MPRESNPGQKIDWQVGGSNDERHHWFLFAWVDGKPVYRNEAGEPVTREEGYVVYRTRTLARTALKQLNAPSRAKPFYPVKGWVWTVYEKWNGYGGSALASERDSDVLLESLIKDTQVRSIRTYTYDPAHTNNTGTKLAALNYTALKKARATLTS